MGYAGSLILAWKRKFGTWADNNKDMQIIQKL